MKELLEGTITPQDWLFVGVMAGILALLIVVFTFFVYGKQVQTLNALMETTLKTQGELNRARETQANIASLEEETAKIRELVTNFERRLPERREILTLLKQFEDLADSVELDHQLKTLPRIPDQKKETIPYDVVIRGNFHQIVTFINSLERFERYLKISNLNIGPEVNGVSEARFVLSTFRFITRPPVRAAKAGAAS